MRCARQTWKHEHEKKLDKEVSMCASSKEAC